MGAGPRETLLVPVLLGVRRAAASEPAIMALERECRGRLLEDAEVGVRLGRGGAGVRVGEPRLAFMPEGDGRRGVDARLRGGDLGTGVWLEEADTKESLDEVVDAVVGRLSGLRLPGSRRG